MFDKRFNLRSKILLAPGICIALFMGYLAITLVISTGNTKRLDRIRDVAFPTLMIANEDISLTEKITENLNSAVATGEKDSVDAADAIVAKLRKNLADFARIDPQQQPQSDAALKSLDAYYTGARALSIGLISKQLDMAQAGPQMSKMGSDLEELNKRLLALRESTQQGFTDTVDASASSSRLMLGVGGVGAIAVLASGFLAWLITATVARSVSSVLRSMRDFASGQGDLTQRIKQETNDEIGELVQRFNEFVSNLHTDVSSLVSSLKALESTVGTLSSSVSEAERHAHEGRAVMTDASQGVTEIRSDVDLVAESADQASTAAMEADVAAKGGYENIHTTIDTIKELAESVQNAFSALGNLRNDAAQIDTVVNTIKGIADQTNLLALNAAIEAARAGEHGRGFAVVADEVRKLSAQTQEATVEVAQIVSQLEQTMGKLSDTIESSQAKAVASVEQIADSGRALEEITGKVSTIRDMNQQIAQRSDHQKRGAQAVAASINSLDEVSTSTLNRSQELANAAHQVQDLANRLKEVASHFKI